MDMRKGISIVAVFYSLRGAESFVRNNLASIEESGIETAIVENGEEKSLILPKNAKYIVSRENVGYGAGANMGIKDSSAEYVLLMNDDIILPCGFFGKLERKIDFYSLSRFRIVGFRVLSDKSGRAGLHMIPYSPLVILYHFSPLPRMLSLFSKSNGYVGAFEGMRSRISSKEVCGVNGSIMLIERKFFEEAGGFDPDYFLTYEETDLFIRTLKRRGKIYYDSSMRVRHTHSITAGEESLEHSFRSMRIFLRKHYGSFAANLTSFWVFCFLMLKRIAFAKNSGRAIELFKKSV